MSASSDFSNAVSKLFTINTEFVHINDTMKRLERGLDEVKAKLADHESRLVRLETERAADKREMQAEVSLFKSEVERFELRLSRLLPPPPPSPPAPPSPPGSDEQPPSQ